MGISIKNPETERLARELAELTGESMTIAVTEALRERVARLSREKEVQERLRILHELVDDMARRFKEPWRSMDWDNFLYDENGLPK